jgi:hypothetical protein
MGRRSSRAAGVAAAFGVVFAAGIAPGSAQAACSPAIVRAKPACLKAGQRCRPASNADYVRYGYRCKRAGRRRAGRKRQARLVVKSLASLRFGDAAPLGAGGQVDTATALQAFASTFAPLPDVTVRPGAVDMGQSGTAALAWIQAHRDQLAPAQQQAVDATVNELFPPAALATAAGTQAEAKADLDDAVQRIGAHVGSPLGRGTQVVFANVKPNDEDLAMTQESSVGPGPVSCLVSVTPAGQNLGPDELYSTMAHEAFHCFQDKWFSDVLGHGITNTDAPWLWEGSASWAEAVIDSEARGFADPTAQGWWSAWMTTPWAPVFQRTYSAVGFFAHLAESGIDPWKLVRQMVQSPDSATAYGVALGQPATANMLNTWAPGYFRSPNFGPGWDFTGPGVPPTAVAIKSTTLTNNTIAALGTQPASADVGQVAVKADVVEVSAEPGGTGFGRLRDQNGAQYPIANGTYCGRPGGCTCPSGGAGPAQPLVGTIAVALTGNASPASSVHLTGTALDSYCEKAPSPAGGTSLSIGPATGTRPGDCTTSFVGSPANFWAFFTSDTSPTYSLQLTVKPYEGAKEYKVFGGGALSAPNVQVSDSTGHIWESRQMPPGPTPVGSFTVTSESSTTMTGTVFAMVSDGGVSDSRLNVSGAWTCDAS